jgi:hypothetical protein
MPYCLEYMIWTGADVTPTFSVEYDEILPGNSSTLACDGIGFIGTYKNEDGLLMLKMADDSEIGYVLTPYLEVRANYTSEPYEPFKQERFTPLETPE